MGNQRDKNERKTLMKKIFAIVVVCTVLAGYVSTAIAGAAGWQNSQSRMRKAHQKTMKQQAEYWKKFDPEKFQVWQGNQSNGPMKKGK